MRDRVVVLILIPALLTLFALTLMRRTRHARAPALNYDLVCGGIGCPRLYPYNGS